MTTDRVFGLPGTPKISNCVENALHEKGVLRSDWYFLDLVLGSN